MSETSHSQEHEQHLIAYLDGELDPAERLLAESLIERYPKLAELLEQWRENSKALRALPSHHLDDSFASRVLEKLDDVYSTRLEDRKATAPHPILVNQDSGGIPWRTALATIATLAAVLLLLFSFFPTDPKEDPVASQEENKGTGVDDIASGPVLAQSDINRSRPITRPPLAKSVKQNGSSLLNEATEIARRAVADGAKSGSVDQVFLITMPATSNGRSDVELICVGNSVRVFQVGQFQEIQSDFKPPVLSVPLIRDDAESVLLVGTEVQMKRVIRGLLKSSQVQLVSESDRRSEAAHLDQWLQGSDEADESKLLAYSLWIQRD